MVEILTTLRIRNFENVHQYIQVNYAISIMLEPRRQYNTKIYLPRTSVRETTMDSNTKPVSV